MTKDTKRSARDQAQAEMLRRYDTRVADFTFTVESRYVSTNAGKVHLLITGPVDAPPLMILHGASENAINSIDFVGPALLDGYRCHWVDSPASPGAARGHEPHDGWMDELRRRPAPRKTQ